MAVTTATIVEPDEDLVHLAHTMMDRAHSLRSQASALPDVLAGTYRRRASELELEAWLLEVTAGVPESHLEAHAL